MRKNLEHFEAKIQITAERKRLNLEKKVRWNGEEFEAKIQITA